ncbi:hypothetical protein SAMN05443575_0483 [Jatrophihabitans endophyticus]|uniref:Uncharacterized protein n=1 Tax=Jatrophihabitans endophyticus TaxID=1206085 RepID=A0A1M5D838_9ACTN|nr:hypothetical protein [Jatrophihabitans endophyticus]SHF63101.1 hypothetical protein SAMN05443575_0483 [Jatrophihabitans endophyticus]
MGLAAVKVRVAGADFFLLPEDDSGAGAEQLAAELTGLRKRTGGALRLRPRTAPEHAPWTNGTAESLLPVTSERALTGHEDPGTSWRDVLGADITSVETVDLDAPVALWHWAVAEGAGGFEVG